jgi:hypothetical protein
MNIRSNEGKKEKNGNNSTMPHLKGRPHKAPIKRTTVAESAPFYAAPQIAVPFAQLTPSPAPPLIVTTAVILHIAVTQTVMNGAVMWLISFKLGIQIKLQFTLRKVKALLSYSLQLQPA